MYYNYYMDRFYFEKSLTNAKNLRSNQTDCESILWQRIRAKRLNGIKFRRQVPIGRYVVDFIALSKKLVIELDGSQHFDNIKYDTTYSKPNTRNIYGALISGEVVCEGYAKSFKYLLDKLGIPCILVSGEAVNSEGKRENHMWNYVKINEIWYAVDVTWDDPIILNNGELNKENRYKYFCQGDNIDSNHFISNKITTNGQEFEYPELYHKEQ